MSSNIKGYNGTLATRLRGLMEDSKTTQIELAKSLRISRQSVSQYMDGSMQPNAEKLSNIAKFFNVSSDYLLGRTNVRTLATDIITACKITHLSEEFVEYLKNSDFRRYETINIMFKNNFIQNIVQFIQDEIAVLIMKQFRSNGVSGITIERNNGEIIREISLESKDIENYFNDKMQEIAIKVISKCEQSVGKVIKDVFDLRKKKPFNAMSEEVFNEAMKKVCLDYCINNKVLWRRSELAKIHVKSDKEFPELSNKNEERE